MASGGSTILIPASMPSPPPTPAPPEAALSTRERLRLAKQRRAAQLKRWSNRERDSASVPDVVQQTNKRKAAKRSAGLKFVASVMLLEAAARNDVQEVRRLLETGVTPDSTNEDGLTALHQCCIDDSEEMMKLLLEFGANVNAVDTEKWTPLHAAATCGHLHLVKFLIEHGANLLAVNADGNMPYDLCEDDTTLSYIENEMAKRGVTQELIDETRATTERQMLHDLKKALARQDEVDYDVLEARIDAQGATPLHVAAANGYVSVVEFLLDHHASTEVVDNDLWQPIHAAACWGHLEVVELLVQNGANVSARTRNGETPFNICEDPEIKERLIQLREQRVRLDQPRGVRRSRSASTRTQSIRRTSLREKMNTTKKDVQDEKLLFYGTLSPLPTEAPPSPPVDIGEVVLEEPVPVTPERPGRLPKDNRGSVSSSKSTSAVLSSSSSADKINIHVSVTINAPPSTSSQNASPQHGSAAATSSPGLGLSSSSNSPSVRTTLADLKRARMQSRGLSNPQLPPQHDPLSSPTDDGHPPPDIPPQQSSGRRRDRPEGGGDLRGANGQTQQHVADILGDSTPKKKGCCVLL